MLPVAQAIKTCSAVLNEFGVIGPVPEIMSAIAALRNKWFSRLHRRIVEGLLVLAKQFEQKNGYSPPYWELVKLARQTHAASIQR